MINDALEKGVLGGFGSALYSLGIRFTDFGRGVIAVIIPVRKKADKAALREGIEFDAESRDVDSDENCCPPAA